MVNPAGTLVDSKIRLTKLLSRITCFTVATLLVAACSDPAGPGLTPPGEADLAVVAGNSADYIQTPAGLYHRSCVHKIPDAAVVNANRQVRLPTGASYQIPRCLYPPRSSVPRGKQAPVVSGWIEYALATNSGPYKRIVADWNVPITPANAFTYTSSPPRKTYYTFPGLMSSEYIIQPVIQFGHNGHYGGSYWTMTSWHCNDGSDCIYNGPVSVNSGDAIHGDVSASNCSGGNCTWTITNTRVSTSQQTILTVVDTENYWRAVGGAVEVYNLATCLDFPSHTNLAQSGVFYSGIALYDNSYNQTTPSWSAQYPTPSPNPSCNFNVTYSSTNVNLFHAPDLYTFIEGPQSIPRFQSSQYTATPWYGASPYTYQWRVRHRSTSYTWGAWSGWYSTGATNSTYTSVNSCGINAAELAVMVTDGRGKTATNSPFVINITNPC